MAGAARPRRKPGENRASLIEAATIEFGLRGYAAAQTSAIAQRAEVSQPNVYANFASKRELFFACLAAARNTLIVSAEHSPPQELALLLYQALAAVRDPSLAPDIANAVDAIRTALGEEAFQTVILHAASKLIDTAAS